MYITISISKTPLRPICYKKAKQKEENFERKETCKKTKKNKKGCSILFFGLIEKKIERYHRPGR
jgi:hypothetical protein